MKQKKEIYQQKMRSNQIILNQINKYEICEIYEERVRDINYHRIRVQLNN